jgi:hypothetical protein
MTAACFTVSQLSQVTYRRNLHGRNSLEHERDDIAIGNGEIGEASVVNPVKDGGELIDNTHWVKSCTYQKASIVPVTMNSW